MSFNETTVLSVRNLSHSFGNGCGECANPDSRSLEKNYCPVCGTVYALQNAGFDLFQREILGVVGESGSGKSTLMRCLYFDQLPDTGEYFIPHFQNGESNLFEVSRQVQRKIRNLVLGMVYQNPVDGLRMGFSSLANIAEKLIAADFRNVSSMTDRAK